MLHEVRTLKHVRLPVLLGGRVFGRRQTVEDGGLDGFVRMNVGYSLCADIVCILDGEQNGELKC